MTGNSKFNLAVVAGFHFAVIAATGCYVAAGLILDAQNANLVAGGWLLMASLWVWLGWFRPIAWAARGLASLGFVALVLVSVVVVAHIAMGSGATAESALELVSRNQLVVLALAGAGVIIGLIVAIGRPAGRQPRSGEFWMAEVLFEDGSGAKDRPCFVVGGTARSLDVLYITSQDKSDRRTSLIVRSSSCICRTRDGRAPWGKSRVGFGWPGQVARRRSSRFADEFSAVHLGKLMPRRGE